MKTLKLLICLWAVLSTYLAKSDAQQPELARDAAEAELRVISKRIDNGNYDAFFDAAKLPHSVAIPFLFEWASFPGDDRKKGEAAVRALKKVQGYAETYRKDLAEATRLGGVNDEAFEILSMIGTDEAAAVVAPYLFDFTMVQPRGDLKGSISAYSASVALVRMKIAGAPAGDGDGLHDFNDIVSWQKWAIARSFVPKDWNSRVGLPDNIRKLNDMMHSVAPQPAAAPTDPVTPAISESANTTHPSESAIPPAQAQPHPSALSPERKSSVWPWVVGILALAVIAILIGRRRK